eukprot:3613838-Rhodomonas_salina.1
MSQWATPAVPIGRRSIGAAREDSCKSRTPRGGARKPPERACPPTRACTPTPCTTRGRAPPIGRRGPPLDNSRALLCGRRPMAPYMARPPRCAATAKRGGTCRASPHRDWCTNSTVSPARLCGNTLRAMCARARRAPTVA